MIKEIKSKLVKFLGGVTRDEHNKFKQSCEDFAREHLISRRYFTCFGEGSLTGGCIERPLIVVGSRTRLSDVTLHGLYVAPWVNCFVADRINVKNFDIDFSRRGFIETQDVDVTTVKHG